jgi:hypothetical protein
MLLETLLVILLLLGAAIYFKLESSRIDKKQKEITRTRGLTPTNRTLVKTSSVGNL